MLFLTILAVAAAKVAASCQPAHDSEANYYWVNKIDASECVNVQFYNNVRRGGGVRGTRRGPPR